MTYACSAWDFAADNHLLKLQRLQNTVLCTIGKFLRCTLVRDLHMAFKPPYIYGRHQAEVKQNHENSIVRNIGQGEHGHRKYKILKVGGGQAYDCSSD
jgi:hypothetical protein